MTAERVGGWCAALLGLASLAAAWYARVNNLTPPRAEAIPATLVLLLLVVWWLHLRAQRPPTSAGDQFWRAAVAERLPEMVRGAKAWGRQIQLATNQGAAEADVLDAIVPTTQIVTRPWGLEVPIWPPEGMGVAPIQNDPSPLLTSLQRALDGAMEHVELVEVVADRTTPGRALLRILPTDPFQHPERWTWGHEDGPMGQRLGRPLGGFDRYGTQVRLPGVGLSVMFAGVPRSGKSTGLVSILRQWLPTRAAIVGVDTVGYGVDLGALRPRLANLYTQNQDVLPLLRALLAERDARVPYMVANGMVKLETDEDFTQLATFMGRPTPPVILAVDEAHDAFPPKSEENELLKRLIKEAAKAGIWVYFATQRVSHQEMDTSLRALFAAGVCFKVHNGSDARMVLGDLPEGVKVGPWGIDLPAQRGMAYVSASEAEGGAVGAGGLVAIRTVQLEVGKRGRAYPEVTAAAEACAGRAPALPWLPTPTGS